MTCRSFMEPAVMSMECAEPWWWRPGQSAPTSAPGSHGRYAATWLRVLNHGARERGDVPPPPRRRRRRHGAWRHDQLTALQYRRPTAARAFVASPSRFRSLRMFRDKNLSLGSIFFPYLFHFLSRKRTRLNEIIDMNYGTLSRLFIFCLVILS